MCSAVSALDSASFSGSVEITEDGLCGMITIRGDLGSEAMAKAVKSAVGLALPKVREIKTGAKGSAAWMSPDELLVIVDYQQADALVAKLDAALKGQHALVINVSDARAIFTIAGEGCREVIAKGAPVDISVDGLKVGELRRSRLGQVAAAFWMADETTIRLVCFRSLAEYVFEFLSVSAKENSLPAFL